MESEQTTFARWVIFRQGDDANWWLEHTSEEAEPGMASHGVLDPQQVAQLVEALDPYYKHGLTRRQVKTAFLVYRVEAEVSEERMRLVATQDNILDGGADLFALPVVGEEGTGPFADFLDALSAARIRLLNATHHYVRNCTEMEMFEELDALDQDRFFSAEAIHVYDEIAEILQWSPAEWDDPSP